MASRILNIEYYIETKRDNNLDLEGNQKRIIISKN